jgi:MATE family multidrug resistance protein
MSAESSLRVAPSAELPPGSVQEVFWLALPVVLQTMAETAMHVIDSALVGRLGTVSLGAIGFAWIWIWTLLVPLAGVTTGVQVFVARHDGAGERTACGPWLWQALWLTLPAMIAWAGAVALFLPALFTAVGTESELREQAIAYGLARLPGAPAVIFEFALASFFRGVGDMRTPLMASAIGVLVNLFCAYALVFGHFGAPNLGIVGAGLAHSLGSYTIAGLLLWAFLRPHVRARYATGLVWPDRRAIARFARTSVPIGGQWLLDMTTFAIFTSIVARMGAAAMAASQAMLQLLSLSFMQAVAISSAAGTLVGRYLGAGDIAAAGRSYRSALTLALGLGALVALLFLSAPEALLGIFADDPAVLALARPLLTLGAFFQVLDAIGIVASGSLRGAGDTRWPFLVHASLAWLLRLPLVYVGAVLMQRGVFGAWSAELIYVAALGATFVLRFRAGHWQSARI